MNLAETGVLLAKMQVTDNRRIDEVVIQEWQEALAEVRFDDGLEGVRWLRRTTAKWLMPFDVIDAARIAKERRLRAEHVAALPQIAPTTSAPLTEADRAAAAIAFEEAREAAERRRAARVPRRA